jgi:hypothetical protein
LGIWLGTPFAGMIPVYEEHLARLERNIGLNAWTSMDIDEKAMIIAMRRIQRAVDNLQSEAEIAKAESKR